MTRFIALTLMLGAVLHAQDLEPRAYTNSPVGMNFFLLAFGVTSGSVLTDPSLPIENVSNAADVGAIGLATTFAVLGQSAKMDLVIPSASLLAEGLVFGLPRERQVSGFGDPLLRFSMNFVGAPALTVPEFKEYEQDFIFGASLRIGAPLGQYDNDKLINIGANRWSIRPELRFSKAFGNWTVEVAPGVAFYTENNDFFGGQSREQAPLYGVQGHLCRTFGPGCWLGLDAAWFGGTQSTVAGIQNQDYTEGTRFGATLALPLNRYYSVKGYAVAGFNADGDHDYEAVGLALQYRWGGGY